MLICIFANQKILQFIESIEYWPIYDSDELYNIKTTVFSKSFADKIYSNDFHVLTSNCEFLICFSNKLKFMVEKLCTD